MEKHQKSTKDEQVFTLEEIEIYLSAMDTESLEYPRRSDEWWKAHEKLERLKSLLAKRTPPHV